MHHIMRGSILAQGHLWRAVCARLLVLELRYRSLRKGSFDQSSIRYSEELPKVLIYRPEGWTYVAERGRHKEVCI